MEDPLIFFVGIFCFVLAIVGVVMTYLEFKNIDLNLKKIKFFLDFRRNSWGIFNGIC